MTRQVRTAALILGGEAMWQDLLSRVSPACQQRFSQPIGYFEWVESDLALELHLAWISLQGEENMADRGSDAARAILDGPQRWLLRMATPHLLVQAMPRLFSFYYRGGQAVVDRLEPGSAELSLWGSGYFPSWFDLGIPAWVREAFRMTGAGAVEIEVLPMDPREPNRHRYRLRWED